MVTYESAQGFVAVVASLRGGKAELELHPRAGRFVHDSGADESRSRQVGTADSPQLGDRQVGDVAVDDGPGRGASEMREQDRGDGGCSVEMDAAVAGRFEAGERSRLHAHGERSFVEMHRRQGGSDRS
jgi:hypothetical protein